MDNKLNSKLTGQLNLSLETFGGNGFRVAIPELYQKHPPLGHIKVMIGTGAESCITELYYPFEFGYENKTFGYVRGLYEDICDTLDIETTE
ncbi:hypothetical protein A3K63_02435 [Candidatus Micrarchaeota archaeon RBG_16_49_10]|nr:MAG: hypothetical protein A3K63_02435 [Candidatus Micrarchaeota archaeon RBG_16_49_10]